VLAISYGPIRHTIEYCISYFGLSETLPNIIMLIPVTGTTVGGTKTPSKLDVISESQLAEDSPKFKQGEKVILFLYKKQLFGDKPFGNDYTVVNYLQGKYGVDENGRVSSLVVVSDTFANKMTIADFQKKLVKI
jgi:hypothetical protein